MTVCGVCETGFRVGKPGQVEGQDEFRDNDIEGGQGADAPGALEGGGGEIGAVGKVEVCFFFFFAARRGRGGFLDLLEGKAGVFDCVLCQRGMAAGFGDGRELGGDGRFGG